MWITVKHRLLNYSNGMLAYVRRDSKRHWNHILQDDPKVKSSSVLRNSSTLLVAQLYQRIRNSPESSYSTIWVSRFSSLPSLYLCSLFLTNDQYTKISCVTTVSQTLPMHNHVRYTYRYVTALIWKEKADRVAYVTVGGTTV